MRFVRVKAATVRRALGLARARLGPDALVLEVSRKGGEVEVLVAAETELAAARMETPATPPAPAARASAVNLPEPATPPEEAALRMPSPPVEDPMARSLRIRLERSGYLGSVARDLAGRASGRFDTLTALREAVARRAPAIDLLRSREPIVLFGAEGSGKTAAAAMLAARAGLAGRRKVLLIEAGAGGSPHPLLSTCARLLHGRHLVLSRTEEIVKEASSADGWLVLIDVASCRPLRTGAPEELRRLASALWGARLVLVADASAPLLLQAQIRALGRSLLGAVGLTRTELSAGLLGPSLSALMEHGARPAFFTSGREIPQSLTLSTPDSFARLVLTSLKAPGPAFHGVPSDLAAAQESPHA